MVPFGLVRDTNTALGHLSLQDRLTIMGKGTVRVLGGPQVDELVLV